MSELEGADLEGLDDLARTFDRSAQRIDALRAELDRLLASTSWVGADAAAA